MARMRRAMAEGACHAHVDLPATLGILYGPIYLPPLSGGRVPDADQAEAHLAIATRAVFRSD